MEIMNEEKMYPRGKGVIGNDWWHSWRDGTHRKTNRYIDPSKHVCVSPRTRRKGSIQNQKKRQSAERRIETTVGDDAYIYTFTDDIPSSSQTIDLKKVVIRYSASTTVILRPGPPNYKPS